MSGLAHKKAGSLYLPTLLITPPPQCQGDMELMHPFLQSGIKQPLLQLVNKYCMFVCVSHLRYCFGNWRLCTTTVLGSLPPGGNASGLAQYTHSLSTCMEHVETSFHTSIALRMMPMTSSTPWKVVHELHTSRVVLS